MNRGSGFNFININIVGNHSATISILRKKEGCSFLHNEFQL